jgi:hypothetical protein
LSKSRAGISLASIDEEDEDEELLLEEC